MYIYTTIFINFVFSVGNTFYTRIGVHKTAKIAVG